MASGSIVALRTTWWVLKDIRDALPRGSRQLVSSLTWRKPIRQPGNMVSSETFRGLASEAYCLFLCYLMDRRIRVKIGTKLSEEFYPEEGGVLAVTCFGLKINELPTCIVRDIFSALFVDDLAMFSWAFPEHHRHLQQAVNAIQEWATRNGFRFAAHMCKVVHFTAPSWRL